MHQSNPFTRIQHYSRKLTRALNTPKSYRLGLAPYRQKDWPAAQQLFEQAISENANHADSHFKLGMCHFRQKSYDQAKASMEQALTLSPERTEWKDQLSQTLRHLGKAANGQSINRSRQAEPSFAMLLEILLLKGEYDKFWDILKSFDNCFPSTENEENLLRLKIEALLMKERPDDDCNEAIIRLSSEYQRDYYLGQLAKINGEHQKALSQLRHAISLQPKQAELYYAFLDVALLCGQYDAGWTIAKQLLGLSCRAKTWQYFAQLVNSNKDLQEYLCLLDAWSLQSSNARHHIDIATATAYACLKFGEGELAKRTLHDCLFYHQNKEGGPTSSKPQVIRFSQDEHMPGWLHGFSNLPTEIVDSPHHRATEALKDAVQFLESHKLTPFLIHDTLLWALSDFKLEQAVTSVTLGLFETPLLDRLHKEVVENKNFTLLSVQHGSTATRFKHRNGIIVEIYIHQIGSPEITHEKAGLRWINQRFLLEELTHGQDIYLIPTNTKNYLDEFGIGMDSLGRFDLVLESKNTQIIDEDHLICYAYQKFLKARIYSLDSLEAAALRKLIELGEHKAAYQQALCGRYTIPDLEMIKRDAPQIALYVSGLENVAYQANMWIPVLERLELKTAIVLREENIAKDLEPTHLPVYFMKSMRDLELLEEGGVQIILYPANTQKNVQTLRFHKMTHCFINHGESDKVVNQSKFLMVYDRLLVAGPLAEKRLRDANLPLRDNQVVHVGRPQVELLLKRQESPKKIETILYAPTWEGFVEEANYSSVSDFGYSMLEKLSQDKSLTILFKAHPYTGYNQNGECRHYLAKIEQLAKGHNNIHLVPSGDIIHDYMNKSDLLITDISSVLNDYLYTLKPIILTNPKSNTLVELHTNYPSSRAAYVLNKGQRITSLLEQINTYDQYLDQRRVVCAESLGDFPEGPMERFNRIVCDLTNQ